MTESQISFSYKARYFKLGEINSAIYLVYGNQDPFLTDERFQEMQALSRKLGTRINELTFDGGHDIDETTLLKFSGKKGIKKPPIVPPPEV